MDSTCLGFVLVLLLVALVVQAVLIGTRWWGSFKGGIGQKLGATPAQTDKLDLTTHVGLFSMKGPVRTVKTESGKARLAQTLATVSLAMALLAALMAICLVSHKKTPACSIRTGATVITMMTFAVSLCASIFATRYVKTETNARYGIAVGLHYVTTLMVLASAVLLAFKTKGSRGYGSMAALPASTVA